MKRVGTNKLITLSNIQIKTSLIKRYGIVNDSNNFQNYLIQLNRRILDLQISNDELRKIGEVFKATIEKNTEEIERYLSEMDEAIRSDKYWLSKENILIFLYITTYQNDTYKFYDYDCNFDIFKKMMELDNLLKF